MIAARLAAASEVPLGSRTVDWFAVHTFVVPVLDRVGAWPVAGTLAWSALDDDDPAKIAALFDAARHHALRVDAAQEALAQASRDIAEAVDSQSIARGVLRQEWRRTAGVYIPRKGSEVA